MRKALILLAFLVNSLISNAQYAEKHYIAPSPWQYWSNANEIVLTTREATPVTVTLKKSDGTLITTLTVTSAAAVFYRFTGVPSTVPRNNVNTVLSDRGLIVEATAAVSVNMRNIASDTAGTSVLNIKGNASLVSFGNEGIGVAFRLGYYRSSYTGIAEGAPIYSVMAIEDATVVSLNGTVLGILNAGQSRLFTATMGSLLSADKPVVANTGAYGDTPQACGGSGEDGAVDQIAPVNMLGKQYMVIRGNGTAGTGINHPEQSTIIASEPNTTLQLITYNAAGGQISSTTSTLAAAGSFLTIHQGDATNAYSSTYITASKPVVVYAGTADGCETDISTVLPIGGCSGSTDIATRKFVSYNNTNLSYFGYCIIESATEPVLINGTNMETQTGIARTAIGTSGFYFLRFTNVNIGNPTNIHITSLARLTTSIIQQGEGSSMSGFFSAFSDSPAPPALQNPDNPCTFELTTTPGLEPYQWYLNGFAVAGATSQNITAVLTGNYTVQGTRACGLTTTSSPVYVLVAPCSDLTLQKEAISVTGNQAVFQITVSNVGTTNETDVYVEEILPSGYTYVSSTASVGNYTPADGLWMIGNIASGASETLNITVTINPTGNFVNSASVIGINVDTNLDNNTDTAEAHPSSMTMTKVAQQSLYGNIGEVITYNLVLTNTGQETITAIAITDTNADAGSITPATVASLAPGASVTVTALHTITAADGTTGFVMNQAAASGLNTLGGTIDIVSDDPTTTAVNDSTKTLVTIAADLVTVKTNNQTIYAPGTTTTYTITITNNGPSTAQNIVVSDPLPTGITTMTWTSSLGTSGTGAIADTIATLANAGVVTYTAIVDIPASFVGALTNTVTVSSDTTDPVPNCTQCTDIDNTCVPPTIGTAGPVQKCDDAVADGFTEVNLAQYNSTITQNNNNWQVVFYLTQADVDSGNPIINPQAWTNTVANDQTVIVEVINQTGCKSYGTLQVLVLQNPSPLSQVDDQLCDNSQHRFDLTAYQAQILNGETGTSIAGYYTSPANATNNTAAIANTSDYEITTATATFYVRVQNAGGCYAISTINLTIQQVPQVNLPAQVAICLDATGNVISPAVLDTGLSTADYTFKWFKGTTELTTALDSSLSVSEAGSYSVEVTSLLGCTGTSASTQVIASNGPETFTAAVITGYFAGDAIIEAIATGTGDFVYWLDYGPEQSSGTFHHVYEGLHTVYVKDANGCGQIKIVEVRVIDYPKFFTPNADSYNDTWNIKGLANQPKATIYIFDRYGKLIKQISPSGPGWDGTYIGNPLPSTDYWFKVEYLENDVPQEFRSHFSLKR